MKKARGIFLATLLITAIVLLLFISSNFVKAQAWVFPDKNLTFNHKGEKYFNIIIFKNFSITNFTGNVTGYPITSLGYSGVEKDLGTNGNTNPYGMTTDGTYFYVLDKKGKTVYKYFSNWTYTGSSFVLNDSRNASYTAYGITTDGTYLWITSITYNEVNKHYMNGTHADHFITFSGGEGCVIPTGITNNGTYFWVTQMSSGGWVCKYSFPDGTFIEKFSAPNALSIAINDSSENHLWVVDHMNEFILKYYTNGTFADETYDAEQNHYIAGLMVNGTDFWTTDGTNKTFANEFMDLFPKNMSIDIGDDGFIDIILFGEINGTYPVDFNVTALNHYLYHGPCRYETQCELPIRVIVRRAGKLNLHDLTIYFQFDGDGDGIPNSEDDCPSTPTGVMVHTDGCMVETVQEVNASENSSVSNEANTTNISIPSGALEEDKNISINATLNSSGYGIKEGTSLQGYIYEFKPSPLNFSKNVTVVMTYEDPGNYSGQEELDAFDIYHYNESSGQWEGQNASQNITLDELTMEIDHFSTFGILVQIENPVTIKSRINPKTLGKKGGMVELIVRVKNDGKEKVRDAYVTVAAPDFEIYETSAEFDLEPEDVLRIIFVLRIYNKTGGNITLGYYQINSAVCEPKSMQCNTFQNILEIKGKKGSSRSTAEKTGDKTVSPTAGETNEQEENGNQVVEDKTEKQEKIEEGGEVEEPIEEEIPNQEIGGG